MIECGKKERTKRTSREKISPNSIKLIAISHSDANQMQINVIKKNISMQFDMQRVYNVIAHLNANNPSCSREKCK